MDKENQHENPLGEELKNFPQENGLPPIWDNISEELNAFDEIDSPMDVETVGDLEHLADVAGFSVVKEGFEATFKVAAPPKFMWDHIEQGLESFTVTDAPSDFSAIKDGFEETYKETSAPLFTWDDLAEEINKPEEIQLKEDYSVVKSGFEQKYSGVVVPLFTWDDLAQRMDSEAAMADTADNYTIIKESFEKQFQTQKPATVMWGNIQQQLNLQTFWGRLSYAAQNIAYREWAKKAMFVGVIGLLIGGGRACMNDNLISSGPFAKNVANTNYLGTKETKKETTNKDEDLSANKEASKLEEIVDEPNFGSYQVGIRTNKQKNKNIAQVESLNQNPLTNEFDPTKKSSTEANQENQGVNSAANLINGDQVGSLPFANKEEGDNSNNENINLTALNAKGDINTTGNNTVVTSSGNNENNSNTSSDNNTVVTSSGNNENSSNTSSDNNTVVTSSGNNESNSNTSSDNSTVVTSFGNNENNSNASSDNSTAVTSSGNNENSPNISSDKEETKDVEYASASALLDEYEAWLSDYANSTYQDKIVLTDQDFNELFDADFLGEWSKQDITLDFSETRFPLLNKNQINNTAFDDMREFVEHQGVKRTQKTKRLEFEIGLMGRVGTSILLGNNTDLAFGSNHPSKTILRPTGAAGVLFSCGFTANDAIVIGVNPYSEASQFFSGYSPEGDLLTKEAKLAFVDFTLGYQRTLFRYNNLQKFPSKVYVRLDMGLSYLTKGEFLVNEMAIETEGLFNQLNASLGLAFGSTHEFGQVILDYGLTGNIGLNPIINTGVNSTKLLESANLLNVGAYIGLRYRLFAPWNPNKSKIKQFEWSDPFYVEIPIP